MTKSLVAGLLLVAGAGFAQDDPPSRVARLNLLNGQVSFQPASVDDWTAATLNYPLTTGDHLYSDQGSRAEMRIGPNAIRLSSQTNFGFLNLDDRTVQMRLTEGSVNIRVRELTDNDVWEVDTPNGAISLLRTGEYRIDTDPERNATRIIVRSGEVEVTANGQSFPVRPNQTAEFAGDAGQQNIGGMTPPDDFDGFCLDRDRREDQIPPPRYVSREMVGYEDLDANGTWQVVGDYGPVWRPRVVMAGWAPYHYGHWAWVEPWGWTWIDDAPWGFAPFHYGRWAYIGGGWGWCPGPVVVARPVYAPALVAFVGGGSWGISVGVHFGGGAGIGWFPLGPREVYAPGYHVSPRYVERVNVTNVTNINRVTINEIVVNHSVTNVTYVNRTAPGGFVAVSRTDFAGARPVHQVAVRVPPAAIASAPMAFNAPVAPQRESVFGRSGNSPVARPSAMSMNRPVMAKVTPPPPPVAFAAKQQALQANNGRPLDPGAVRQFQRPDAMVQRPAVRAATQPAPAARPAFNGNPGGFGRPQQQATPQPQPQQPANNTPSGAPNNFGRPQDRMSSRPPSAVQPGNNPNQNTNQFERPRPQPNATPQETPNRNNQFERPRNNEAQPQQERARPERVQPQPQPQAQPQQERPRPERVQPQPQPQAQPQQERARPERVQPQPQPQAQPQQHINNEQRMNSRPPQNEKREARPEKKEDKKEEKK